MSWTDDEIEKIFKESADKISFEYDDAYWDEMESLLPRKKRKGDFLWFFTALIALSGIIVLGIQTSIPESDTALSVENKDVIEMTMLQKNEDIVYDEESPILSESITPSDSKSSASKLGEETKKNKVLDRNHSVDKVSETLNVTKFDRLEQVHISSHEVGQIELHELTNLEVPRNDDLANLGGMNLLLPWAKRLYLELNSGVNESWISPSSGMGHSFGIGGGMQWQKGRFGWTTGFYTTVRNPGNLALTRTAKVYGFGSEVYSYNLKYKQIFLLEAYLGAQFNCGRHTISAGIKPAYVVGSKVSIEESGSLKSIETTPVQLANANEERNVYGYMAGLHRLNLQPVVGYSYGFGVGLELGANLGMQILPLIQEDFISGANRKLPIQGQLFIRKSIVVKK